MSSYVGRYAELYDLIYTEKPYKEEANFVHSCFQRSGDNKISYVLELGCGTGSYALALESLGYKVIAVDYSKDMLAVAKQKAVRNSSNVDFYCQDMRSLDLGNRVFDAVVCLFNSIGYVLSDNDIKETLKGVRRHLKPNGLFVFDFWNARAVVNDYEPVRMRRWKTMNGELLRIVETTLERPKQLCSIAYTIYELNTDKTYNSSKETQLNRYFSLEEIVGLLKMNGFTLLKLFSGFSNSEEISDSTWCILVVASRDKD